MGTSGVLARQTVQTTWHDTLGQTALQVNQSGLLSHVWDGLLANTTGEQGEQLAIPEFLMKAADGSKNVE
ncbi:hypothetical protein LSAT2_010822 [Lamellibrachia satsuma]|nr:hypothetical protein LSAT2_010822 [Lamellibrachia satsuma]